jgi:extradiol dioxygenase family protein
MKLIFCSGILFLFSLMAWSQNPVSWSYTQKKIGDKVYEVHLTASIAKGWHIYSQHQSQDAIALPTSVKFNSNPLVSFKGKIDEKGTLETVKDEVMQIENRQYENVVDFVQLVNKRANVKTNVAGEIEFMACTGERCLPAKKINFSVVLD